MNGWLDPLLGGCSLPLGPRVDDPSVLARRFWASPPFFAGTLFFFFFLFSLRVVGNSSSIWRGVYSTSVLHATKSPGLPTGGRLQGQAYTSHVCVSDAGILAGVCEPSFVVMGSAPTERAKY